MTTIAVAPACPPPSRQGPRPAAAAIPRWRGPDLRCSPLAAAGASPAAGPQSAADLGLGRQGASALSAQLRARGPAGLGGCPIHGCPGARALQRLQPRKQKMVLVHAFDGSGRNSLHLSVRVLGKDDIHSMGLIKGLHHLDAIAQ